MSQIVLNVEDISKLYRLGQIGTGTLSHDLNRLFFKILGKPDPYSKIGEVNDRTLKGSSQYIWAIKNISFNVNEGEVLGIIGLNGAGKSTLLKILSRVTSPTTGTIKYKGRIASLLEVGTGFHPEMTAKENIFLNGSILGMKKAEIIKKFDEIVDFAGIERYIDTPVKRFSSGMYVRLAFAVAAHLDPEILVIDEVLAVGDAEFQKKCLGKIENVSKTSGKTVLFVSHNMNSIRSICNRCILLEKGTLKIDSFDVEDVIKNYFGRSLDYSNKAEIKFKNDIIEIDDINFINNNLNILKVNQVDIREKFGIRIDFVIKNSKKLIPTFWIAFYNHDGSLAFLTTKSKNENDFQEGPKTLVCWVPENLLNTGTYLIRISCIDPEKQTTIFDMQNALILETIEDINKRDTPYIGVWYGALRPQIEWESI